MFNEEDVNIYKRVWNVILQVEVVSGEVDSGEVCCQEGVCRQEGDSADFLNQGR